MQRPASDVQPTNPTDFGGTVAVDGERIIVWADEDYGGGDYAGAAHPLELIAGTWTQTK